MPDALGPAEHLATIRETLTTWHSRRRLALSRGRGGTPHESGRGGLVRSFDELLAEHPPLTDSADASELSQAAQVELDAERSLTPDQIRALMELLDVESSIEPELLEPLLHLLECSLWWRKGGEELLDLRAPAHQELSHRLLARLADDA